MNQAGEKEGVWFTFVADFPRQHVCADSVSGKQPMVKVNQAERGREFVDRISINLSLYTYFTLHSSLFTLGTGAADCRI